MHNGLFRETGPFTFQEQFKYQRRTYTPQVWELPEVPATPWKWWEYFAIAVWLGPVAVFFAAVFACVSDICRGMNHFCSGTFCLNHGTCVTVYSAVGEYLC